jgi:signal transduction histidine kinase/ActR/RegA family two-component response regulator
MHPTVARHLAKLRLSADAPPTDAQAWNKLLAALSASFEQADADRQLAEHTMSVASDEMAELHASLAAKNDQLETQVMDRTAELAGALLRAEAMNASLQQARLAAEAASRVKTEFLANMSHEIRTPLTAILGFTDLLADEVGDATSRTERIDTIRRAGKHLLTIINDILDLTKIEAGKMTVESVETPLAKIVHEVISLIRPRAAAKGVELIERLRTPLPDSMLSDPTRLRQILMNLIGNAAKFTQQGSIIVSLGSAHGRLHIDIEDTGPGMTPEQSARLFQAFSQADNSLTRVHGGTGLGLTISQRYAQLMQGDVTLVRTAPSQGSNFRINLPLIAAPNAKMTTTLDVVSQSPHTTQPEVTHLPARILVAEDGPDNQRLISFHLRKAGATVDLADNGAIALRMIEQAQQPYDLLISDMQMPEMDGYTLARTLRERGSNLPIIALTAHAMSDDAAKCINAGCDDYATKPINRTQLLATCDTWLKQSKRPAA